MDISDLSIKLVHLKKKGKVLDVASFGETKLKPGLVEKGEVKDEKGLAEAIKSAAKQVKGEKLSTNYAIVGLPEEKTFSEVIQMPKIKEEELRRAVYFEAENHIPLPIEQVYLDFQVVEPLKNHLDHIDVLLSAIPKTIADAYVNAVKKAGLRPLALESESQAVARALIKDNTTSSPVLIVDLGALRTGFTVFSGRSLRFTSSIPISCHEITAAIARALSIDIEKVAALNARFDIKEKDKDGDGRKIFEALVPVFTDLLEQIKKCIEYYQTHSHHEHLADGKKMGKIYLCGGWANITKDLTGFLAQELKIPVELADPWVNVAPGKNDRSGSLLGQEQCLSYVTALGLALRGIRQ